MLCLFICLKNNPYKTDGSQLSNWHPTGIELLKHLSQNTTAGHFTPQPLLTTILSFCGQTHSGLHPRYSHVRPIQVPQILGACTL